MRTNIHSCSHHHCWFPGELGSGSGWESTSGMFRKWGWKSFSSCDPRQQESPVLEEGLA